MFTDSNTSTTTDTIFDSFRFLVQPKQTISPDISSPIVLQSPVQNPLSSLYPSISLS